MSYNEEMNSLGLLSFRRRQETSSVKWRRPAGTVGSGSVCFTAASTQFDPPGSALLLCWSKNVVFFMHHTIRRRGRSALLAVSQSDHTWIRGEIWTLCRLSSLCQTVLKTTVTWLSSEFLDSDRIKAAFWTFFCSTQLFKSVKQLYPQSLVFAGYYVLTPDKLHCSSLVRGLTFQPVLNITMTLFFLFCLFLFSSSMLSPLLSLI